MNIHKARKLANLVFRHAYLLLIASFGLFPFIWTVSSSFKTQQELYTTLPSLLPNDPSLINYQYVLTGVQGVGSAGAGQLLILYRNSLVVSTVSTVSHVLIVSLAGYAFARLKFRGRDALFYFFIVLMFLPAGGTLVEDETALAAQHHVLGDREHGNQHEVLVHHADPRPDGIARALEGDRLVIQQDLPVVGVVEPVEHVHQRALAGAVLPEQGVDLTLLDHQVDVVVGHQGTKGLGDPTQFELHRSLGSIASRSGTA